MPAIHHIALSTSDLDRMVDFYVGVMAFEQLRLRAWSDDAVMDSILGIEGSAGRYSMLRGDNCNLELFEFSNPPARNTRPLQPNDHGYTHLAFVVEDLQAEHDRLATHGVPFTRIASAVRGVSAVYGRDPDGNIFELLEIARDPVSNDIVAARAADAE